MKTSLSYRLSSKFQLLACFLSLLAGISGSQAQIPEIKWEQDLPAAIQKAKSQDKLILIHFTADWSKKSRDIKAFVFKSSRVVRAVETNVVPVMIDVDRFPELAQEYGVEEIPYDLVLTPGKRVVARRLSPVNSDNYGLMIEKLDRTINLIKDKGIGFVDKNVDEMHELVAASQTVQQHKSFAASGPTTPSMSKSLQANELSRKSQAITERQGAVVTNQHFAQTRSDQESLVQPNSSTVRSNNLVTEPDRIGGLKIINNKFFQAESSAADQQNRLTASTMTPNLVSAPPQKDSEAKVSLPVATDLNAAKFILNKNSPRSDFNPNQATSASLSIVEENPNQTMGYQVENSAPATPQLALKGYCPVTLIKEKKWIKGDTSLGCYHRDRLYFFASEENFKEFQDLPDHFSPLLAGFDPVEFDRSGELIVGKEELGAFLGNPPNYRVVLFSSQENRTEFENNPRRYLEKVRAAMQQAETNDIIPQ